MESTGAFLVLLVAVILISIPVLAIAAYANVKTLQKRTDVETPQLIARIYALERHLAQIEKALATLTASPALPAVLEKGVYAPALANIPAFGQSLPTDHSALLAFSPVLNGHTDKGSGQDQGFSTALANGGIDPINVFPIGPDNNNPSTDNNYSPLWDAHVSMWTDKAIAENKVHRISSIAEQKKLIAEGYLTSAGINPPGPGNAYVGGLRPTQAIINCPAVAHPELPPQ